MKRYLNRKVKRWKKKMENMSVTLSFNEEGLNAIRKKFEIKNENDLYDAVIEMISTYLEL